MNTLNNPQPPSDNSYDDEIDLRELLLNIWKYKILIIALAFVGSVFGSVASFYSKKEVSESLFFIPDVPLARLKIYQNNINNPSNLKEFLENSENVNSDVAKQLNNLINKPEIIKAVTPFLSLNDGDAKQLGVKNLETKDAKFIGFNIIYKGNNGVPVSEVVETLGEYIRNTIIRIDMNDVLRKNNETLEITYKEIENQRIKSDFSIRLDIEQQILKLYEANNNKQEALATEKIKSDFEIIQQEKRSANLQELESRVTKSQNLPTNNILSITRETEVYLPIDRQLIANKIRTDDLRLAEPRRKSELLMGDIKRQFYLECLNALRESKSGREFLETIKLITQKIFSAEALREPAYAQAWNDIEIQRKGWEVSYIASEAKYKRELLACEIKMKYYKNVLRSFMKSKDKSDFIKNLQTFKQEIIAEYDPDIDFIQLVSNEINFERLNWNSLYLVDMRFSYPPKSVNYLERKITLRNGLLIGLMAGGMGGCFLALFLSWWKKDSDNTAA